jgi:ABC-type dipeptide/oligopeptide/nickel transport system permease component
VGLRGYVFKRVTMALISLVGASFIAFIIFHLLPGDQVLLMTPAGTTAEYIEKLRQFYGLDQPVHVRYARWLLSVINGDYGVSPWFRRPVAGLIIERLPASIELIGLTMVIAVGVGVVIGVLSSGRHKLANAMTGLSFLGFAIPNFIWGIIFIILFGAIFRVVPISGRIDPSYNIQEVTGFLFIDTLLAGNLEAFTSVIQHATLPAIALAMSLIAMIHRTLRTNLLDVLNEDYIFTDRMKGLTERYIVWVRALKNAIIPTITIIGVQFNFLIGGSVVIEMMFSWPGIGELAMTAVRQRDIMLIQGCVMTYSILVIASNILVDLTYAILNPRIRYD